MTVWIQNPFDNLPVEGFRRQRFWLMAEAFVRAGHRVVLWTSDFNHTTKRKRVLLPSAPPPPFDLRLIPTPAYPKNVCLARIRSHRRYADAWETAVMQFKASAAFVAPDLLVASTPTVSGAETALRLGRSLGAKVVIDVMDAWPETFERLAPARFRGLARLALSGLRRRAQRLYREADLVTGVCDRYQALTGRTDYYRAYHGIELTAADGAAASRSAHIAGRPVRLVYVGNLGRTYDLGTVLRGLGKLANVTLDIAGKGPCEDQWKALTRELGLDATVRFCGYLGEAELKRLLSACDIGIVPMPADSFVGVPYKFADYTAAGLGIVSSLGGESEALLKKHNAGMAYQGGDADSFAMAVRTLSANLSELPDRARKLAQEEFDAIRIYDAYADRLFRLIKPELSPIRVQNQPPAFDGSGQTRPISWQK